MVEGQRNLASLNSMEFKERNYMGVSDCSSSVDSSAVSAVSNESGRSLKATELRLGLPGFQSPERNPEAFLISSSKLNEKPLFPLHPLKDCSSSSRQKAGVSGTKRGHDAIDCFSESKCSANVDSEVILSPRPSCNMGSKPGPLKHNPVNQTPRSKDLTTLSPFTSETKAKGVTAANNNGSPAIKAQVVGWPPIRSFRKNSLATTSKNAGEDERECSGALFVKVSMDGAPYLRKVDLKAYTNYQKLSSGLEKMFSCFTIGQCAPTGSNGREMLSESKLKDLLHGSEYVLTYEDKDGDWMLVGDVPWEYGLFHVWNNTKKGQKTPYYSVVKLWYKVFPVLYSTWKMPYHGMFISSCKRLRIMKGSDAIGLAPRALDKSRNRN